jgi:hypothetical protein
MHAIQARDAVWRRQQAATAARLPPRDAHVKAWRVARLQAIGEEARAAVRCAEAARDAIELANRELAAARASDRVEILQLRELIETSAVDQAELLRLRELTKTPAFDHAELLRHKAGLVRHNAALDEVYKELDGLKGAHDGIYTELNALENIYTELDELKAVRLRCPSPSWRVAATEKLSDQESQLRCVKEGGVFTAARLERSHDFTSADFMVHDLDVKMRKAILELRRDLLSLNTSWVVATQEANSCRSGLLAAQRRAA